MLKLAERPYSELNWLERLGKLLIPVREHIGFRALQALPQRLVDELRLLYGRPLNLRFRPLFPRWDLIETYGHTSDDDAVADIDPHAAICFFKSRGYEILSHPSLFVRLTARHEPLSVRKPLTRQ